jgi:AhpD family alkylhydroperoxidase
MTRIDGVTPQRAGLGMKLLYRFARRSLPKLTGTAPDGALAALEIYALQPKLLRSLGMLEGANAKLHGVDSKLKALARLRAATITGCEYCIDIGSQISRRSGLSDAQLLDLHRYRDSELFSDLEKLVLDFATGMSVSPVVVSDELFAALREHFDDRQLVELASFIALENLVGRFNHAFDIGSAGFSEGMVCARPQPALRLAG